MVTPAVAEGSEEITQPVLNAEEITQSQNEAITNAVTKNSINQLLNNQGNQRGHSWSSSDNINDNNNNYKYDFFYLLLRRSEASRKSTKYLQLE